MNMLTQIDPDLLALQQVRDLLCKAQTAAQEFAKLDEATAKSIAKTVSEKLSKEAQAYAELELAEGGFGKVADKVYKNLAGSQGTYATWKDKKLGGIRKGGSDKIMEIARPAGVIVGLSNSTSPVATVWFKSIISLMTRNCIIFSPHPALKECTIKAANELAALAEAAGAPKHCVQILEQPTIDAVNKLMSSDMCDLILATGGGPMVRAAYSSGNPALGVGPGNAPVYVDASADLELAAERILEGKNFDYGTPCSAPSVILCHRSVSDKLKQIIAARDGHICTSQETQKLRDHVFPKGRLNVAVVGKSSNAIASAAKFSVKDSCRALVAEVDKVCIKEPLLKEKLSPVLGFVEVDCIDDAIGTAQVMLQLAGAGHTSGIYSADPEQAVIFAAALDYYRVIVNGMVTMGSIGMNTSLPPTFTIGTGFAGRSSVGHNVGADDLIDWKKVAFPIEDLPVDPVVAPVLTESDEWKQELRSILREELKNCS